MKSVTIVNPYLKVAPQQCVEVTWIANHWPYPTPDLDSGTSLARYTHGLDRLLFVLEHPLDERVIRLTRAWLFDLESADIGYDAFIECVYEMEIHYDEANP